MQTGSVRYMSVPDATAPQAEKAQGLTVPIPVTSFAVLALPSFAGQGGDDAFNRARPASAGAKSVKRSV